MTEQPPQTPPEKPMDLGVYARPDRGLMAADIIAIALSALWLLGVAIYFLAFREEGQEGTPLGYVMSMLAIGYTVYPAL